MIKFSSFLSILIFALYFLLNLKIDLKSLVNKMTVNIKKRVIIIFVIVFILSYFLSIYLLNDDISMLIISSRNFSSFNSHIVYMNILIGYILSTLYFLSNMIEWYTLFYIIIHTLSILFILESLTLLRISSFFKRGLFVSFILLEYSFITELQFTSLALNTGIASIFLFSRINKDLKSYVLPFIFLLICFAIRNFLGVLCLGLMFYISKDSFYIFFNNLKLKKYTPSFKIWFLFFAFIGMAIMLILDIYMYNISEDFNDFRKTDTFRSMINDGVPINFTLNNKYKEFDFNLIKTFFYDATIYNLNYLKGIYDSSFTPTLNNRLNNAITTITHFKYVLILYFFFNSILFFKVKKYRSIILDILLLILTLFLVSLVYNVVNKERFLMGVLVMFIIKDIVYFHLNIRKNIVATDFLLVLIILNIVLNFLRYSIQIEILINIVVFLFCFNSLIHSKIINYIVSFGFIFLITFSVTISRIVKNEKEKKITDFSKVLNFVIDKRHYNKVITLPTHLYLENLNVHRVSEYKYLNNIILNGWMANLPQYRKDLPSFKNLVTDTIPIIINKKYRNSIKELQKSILYHWKINTTQKIIYSDNYFEVIILNKK